MESSPEDRSRRIVGEDPGVDMRRPLARHANKIFRSLRGQSAVIDLGEHGEIDINNIRFRDAIEEGKLVAYIRQEATDPKVIVPVVVALGAVAAGIAHLKYRKK